MTHRLLAITPRPADLLRIIFQTFRQIVVVDTTNITFIYAHTKRYGGDHDARIRLYKPVLNSCPLIIFHTRMIMTRTEPVIGKMYGNILSRFL